MAPVIDIQAVVKRFGSTVALDGLDLQVEPGEVHAFLGPNGAGKTTTLRILLGLLRIDSGSITLLGGEPWSDAVELHKRLAYVPGEVNLWPQLTGGEVIDLLGRLHGGLDPERRERYIEMFELDPTKKARSYSKGNRQKVALISALATDVPLLLLDEPTSGLDPLMDARFRECVHEFRDNGGTVLLSSHILSEAEALSDRVTIIRNGRSMESGTLQQLRHLSRTKIVAVVHAVPAGLADIPGVFEVAGDGTRVTCEVDDAGLGPVMAALSAAGLHSLTSQQPTLEEVFLKHYRDGSSDA
jgi:polyether ionophore transport system ATP-binding protein